MNYCTLEQRVSLTNPAAIDDLMAERKALAGNPGWIFDGRGSVASLAVPVSIQGAVRGLIFRATALVHEPAQSGSCVLILDGRPIQRLSFRPTHIHVNPFGASVALHLRGLRFPAGKSRIHPWSQNREWPRPKGDNVAVAEPMVVEPGALDTALAIFLHLCNVDGTLPPAPWEPRLL